MNKWIMKISLALLAMMIFASGSSKNLLLKASQAHAGESGTRGSSGGHGGSCE